MLNGAVFTEALSLSVAECDVENELVRVRLCVTGGVAVGTPRDGQDATGQNAIVELYLA